MVGDSNTHSASGGSRFPSEGILPIPLGGPEPMFLCQERGIGITRSQGVYFGVLQAHATMGVVGRGYD